MSRPISWHVYICKGGERAEDAGVGRHLGGSPLFHLLLPKEDGSLGGLSSGYIQAFEIRWLAPNLKENHALK